MVETARRPRRNERADLPSRWPLRRRALLELTSCFAGLTAAGLFTGWLLLGPLAGSALAEWDRDVAAWLAGRRTQTLDTLTDVGSAFSDTIVIIVSLSVLMVAMTLVWRRWRESLTLGVALGLEASVFLLVSTIVGRDRPPVEQLDPSPPTASFPSGHTGAAFAFYIGLAVVVHWVTRNQIARLASVIAAALIPMAVAVSRMYRGMHYASDVVVGAALGVTCVVVAVVLVRRAIARRGVET